MSSYALGSGLYVIAATIAAVSYAPSEWKVVSGLVIFLLGVMTAILIEIGEAIAAIRKSTKKD